ncbi:uncharacterized protein LOC129753793 [Uranotaenia lowii]|uniref:uncharacterized protein LOC129753793 n=1 Tax=Uranotaenia lowii TaxID=190385 RepID=UPI002479D6B5|nr:uncharacterized protein LOC129753793 [Uranotaenia lowii]
MDSITPNVNISRMQDGELLLKTVDRKQAEKLVKQSSLGGIPISIVEHGSLNNSIGTIFCYDLKMHKDEEILSELSSQGVTQVKRMQRKNSKGKLEDTGSFILTFNLSNLPSSIDVGFYSCKVRQYIPNPLRCMNCLRFGHKKTQCKGNQICGSCAHLFHGDSECEKKFCCINCQGDHHALSKECPIYIDEYEIQKIKVSEKISMREARMKRRLQTPYPAPPRQRRSYAEVTMNQVQRKQLERPEEKSAPSNYARSGITPSSDQVDRPEPEERTEMQIGTSKEYTNTIASVAVVSPANECSMASPPTSAEQITKISSTNTTNQNEPNTIENLDSYTNNTDNNSELTNLSFFTQAIASEQYKNQIKIL